VSGLARWLRPRETAPPTTAATHTEPAGASAAAHESSPARGAERLADVLLEAQAVADLAGRRRTVADLEGPTARAFVEPLEAQVGADIVAAAIALGGETAIPALVTVCGALAQAFGGALLEVLDLAGLLVDGLVATGAGSRADVLRILVECEQEGGTDGG
jgi:hypothetical protein